MARRVADRERIQAPAKIVRFDVSLDCVIKDISATGARLKVADPSQVPGAFELVARDRGIDRPAHVRWRKNNEVGVSFSPERRVFGRRNSPIQG